MAAGALASEVDVVVGLQEAGLNLAAEGSTGAFGAGRLIVDVSSTSHVSVH